MSDIKLTPAEHDLVVTLLTKEIEETRVEHHHSRNNDYKSYLRDREEMLKHILSLF